MTGAWTPSLVAERLEEAADVLKRMPPVKVQGYFSAWPEIVPEFSDLVGQKPKLKRPPPLPDAISRMDETLEWTIGLAPVDGKIVWLRAYKRQWKVIAFTVGLKLSTVNEHWLYALCLITWKLNHEPVPKGRVLKKVLALCRASFKK